MTQPETPPPRWQWNHSAMLKGLRAEFELSQADVARRAGVSQSRLSRIESGAEPTISEFVAIADALRLHPCDLLPQRHDETTPIIVPPRLYGILSVLTRIPEDELGDVSEIIYALDSLRENAAAHSRMREQTRALFLRSEHAMRDAREAELSGDTAEIEASLRRLKDLVRDLAAEAMIETNIENQENLASYFEIANDVIRGHETLVDLLGFARAFQDRDSVALEQWVEKLRGSGFSHIPGYLAGHLMKLQRGGASLDPALLRGVAGIPQAALAEAESISLSELLSRINEAAGDQTELHS